MSGADLLSCSVAKTVQYGRAAASAAKHLPPPHAHNPTLTNFTPTHSNPYTTHMNSLFVQKGLRLAGCVVRRENSADEPGRVSAFEKEESVVLFSFE